MNMEEFQQAAERHGIRIASWEDDGTATFVVDHDNWKCMRFVDTMRIMTHVNGVFPETTIIFHDWETSEVFPRLQHVRTAWTIRQLMPLSFWGKESAFTNTAITVNAFLARALHLYRHQLKFPSHSTSELEVMKLTEMGQDVNLLVARMRWCPSYEDVSDAECAKVLMSGIVDVEELHRIALIHEKCLIEDMKNRREHHG